MKSFIAKRAFDRFMSQQSFDFKYHAHCNCGSVDLTLKLRDNILDLTARQCDCDFCISRNIHYFSTPNACLTINAKHSLEITQQGSMQAEFLTCTQCKTVLAASVIVEGGRIGAVNITCFNSEFTKMCSVVVSPKELSKNEKRARWEQIWMPIQFI